MRKQIGLIFMLLICVFFVSSTAFAGKKTPPARTGAWYTSYYGTTNTTAYNTAAADWVGGQVYLDSKNWGTDQLGNSSNQAARAFTTDKDDNKILVNVDTGYKIKSIQWAEASWSNSNSVTITGTWQPITGFESKPSKDFDFKLESMSSGNKYVIWVQFETQGSTSTAGGQVGAWWGTNNTIDYDSPEANGKGGSVKRNDTLINRKADSYTRSDDAVREVEVIPWSGYRIDFIRYGETLTPTAWIDVTVSASQTSSKKFNLNISGGKQYVIWVVFASTSATQYTVSGAVDTINSDSTCSPWSVSPATKDVNKDSTTTFTLSSSNSCVVESVTFNGVLTTSPSISGSTYTTPIITGDSSFTVKFIPNSNLSINASVDAASPTGSGTISPAGSAIPVTLNGSKDFVITANAGYSIAHVYVTDTDRGYNNTDIAPLSSSTYTFNNITANGMIKVVFTASSNTPGDDYCQIPPFVQGQSNLSPNVLIVFDNSGSMGGGGNAYFKNNKPYNCTSSHSKTNKCPTEFYGYFDPYTMYKTDPSNNKVYLKDTVTLNMSSGGKSGNYLNYLYMDKVDVVRKVLVGGRVTDKASTSLAGTSRGTLTTKYLYSNTGYWVEYGTAEPVGIIQNLAGKVRFGLEVFGSTSNSSSDGGTIVAKLGSPTATLVSAVEGARTNPSTSTPIAEALYEAVRYFQAKPSAYNSGTDYGDSTWNPADDKIVKYACQKHFILLLTDGEANNNNKLPGLSAGTLNASYDTVFDVIEWGDRILAADLPGSSDGKYVDAVGFYAHDTDLRSSAFNNDVEGMQNLTIFSVYAFGNGTGTKTLQMLSKYGGYTTKNGNDAGTDPDKYASPDQDLEWDKDGNGVPDTYYEADDGAVLETNIAEAMTSILSNVASGTAASILSNSQGSGASLLQAVYYPSKIFEHQSEAKWIGELQNLWYYIDPYLNNSTVREDTDSNGILNLSSDKVANFYFNGTETKVELYSDTNGDGKTLTSAGTVALDDVKSIWRAGKLLQARTSDSRTIHTSVDGSSLLLPSNSGGGFSAATTTATALQPYLQTANNDSLLETSNIINYIRGTDGTYRPRKVSLIAGTDPSTNWKEWKLGDIVTSTPQIQSNLNLNYFHLAYGDLSYKKFINSSGYAKRGMVYVGANDGMLHAFKLGKFTTSAGASKATLTGGTDLGEEKWAYIPRNALPYLKYLTDVNYKHLVYVDGPTVLSDVSIKTTTGCSVYADCLKDETNGTNWSTVLIGSMGQGGASADKGDGCVTGSAGLCVQPPIAGTGYSSYFAFDIANQYFNDASPNSTLNAQPTFKWEFSPPGLGYATSGATIIRVSGTNEDGTSRVKKNGKWFAVFASGPTGPIDTSFHKFLARSNQNLKIFVVDLGSTSVPLVEGTDYWVIDSGIPNAFGGNMLNAALDIDRGNASSTGYYQDDILYVGYTRANESTITASTKWDQGGVLRIITKEDPNPANWVVGKVIDGIGPVTGAIDSLQDKNNKKLWLFFGSGRFYYSGDDSASQRYLFGVQDRCYTTNNVIDKNCDLTAIPDATPAATGKGAPLALSDITNQSTSIGSVSKGWYIKLRVEDTANFNGAERVISRPSAQNSGSVFFTTLQPTSDICKFGGTTHLWAVNYLNGDVPLCNSLSGTTLLQMTSGAFEQVKFSDIFTCKATIDGPAIVPPPPPAPPAGYTEKHFDRGGSSTLGFAGGNTDARSSDGLGGGSGGDIKPPKTRPLPRKEIVHIKEK